MEINKRLGGYHPSAQNTIIYIGDMLRQQGSHKAAERIYIQALRYVPEPRDPKDPITPKSLRALEGLASSYYYMNRLDKMLELTTEQCNLTPTIFGRLDRLLLRRTDDLNVQMAFSYQITKDRSFIGNGDIWCDGYRCRLSIVTGH